MSELWINICPQLGHIGSRSYTLSYPSFEGKRESIRAIPRADRRHFRPPVAAAKGRKKRTNKHTCSNSTGAHHHWGRGEGAREKSYIASASGVTSQTRRQHMNNIAPRHIAAFPPWRHVLRDRLDGVFADWIQIGKGSLCLRVAAYIFRPNYALLQKRAAWRKIEGDLITRRFCRKKGDRWKSNCRTSSFGSQFWASRKNK